MSVITEDGRRGFTAPERTLAQRREALQEANRIRAHRAKLKVKLKRRVASPAEAFFDADCGTMHVFDLLLHVPSVGRVKAGKILKRAGVAPSKTIAGLSERQRGELLSLLDGGA